MASVIKAGNATDGVQVTSDNTGILELKTGTGAGTTAVTVDASQNTGFGVTPSAWNASFYRVLQVSDRGAHYASNTTSYSTAPYLFIGNNAFSDVASGAGFKYVTTNPSAQYRQVNAEHQWFTAASGTAGNAITFTQAMTLDASGNLGIGTTSAVTLKSATTLQVNGNAKLGNANDRGLLSLGDTASTGANCGIWRGAAGAYGSAGNYLCLGGYDGITFTTGNSDISTQTERMRIDASGYTQFSSNLVMPYQGAPTSKAAAATLTGAELITGILNTTGTTYTITLPTGANIEGALTWAGNNVSLDWYVINTASGTITIGANGNTTLGSLTIATGTSAQFRIRRTAANTFTVYRL